MSTVPILEMKNISKRFAGILALDRVDYAAYPGEVNVLIGENGAGKSTLMRILAGAHTKDGGTILISGKEVDIRSPIDARNHEISMIYQELNQINEMTVCENIYLGHEMERAGFLNKRKQLESVRGLFDQLQFDIDVNAKIVSLSAAQRQMVEIAKAIHLHSKIIIMDEPTSSLAENEVEVLFRIMRRLTAQGICIIFISHRMNEIFQIGDRVTVMRDGKKVGDWMLSELTQDQIISHMVGRQISTLFCKEEIPLGETVLEVRNLGRTGAFEDVSFSVRAGEVVGFSGLMGAGRSEVMKALFGEEPYDRGEVRIDDRPVRIRNQHDALALGIGFVPEDRKNLGLNATDTVEGNLSLTILKDIARAGFIDKKQRRSRCMEMVDKLRIRISGLGQTVSTLSGGNQQKVVIGKWMLRMPRIMILDEPTRGVDVGAKAEIHRLIMNMAKKGTAVILVSSELPEILGMADRVAVMHEGRVTGTLAREEMTQESIMRLATASNTVG